MDDLYITSVPTELLDKIWPEVKGLLQSALDHAHGEMNIDDVKNFIMMNSCQLWVVISKRNKRVRMAITTQVLLHRRKKVCGCILAGGGNIKMWRIAAEHIAEWAKSTGCDRIESHCRPGFEKVFKPDGYKKLYTILAKEL